MNTNNKHVKYAVTINRERMDVYSYWRNWENLPKFARHLVSVVTVDDQYTDWTAEGPVGNVSWRAETIEDRHGEQIAWRSVEGSDIENHGVVQFFDAPKNRGTEVRVYISYDAPGGTLGKWFAKATGNEPQQEVSEMMRRFKAILECGHIPIVEGQSSNRMRNDDLPGDESNKVGFR